MKWLYPEQMARLRRRAYEGGGQFRQTRDRVIHSHMEWNVAGNCNKPLTVEVKSRPELKRDKAQVMDARGHTQLATLEVRCRQCENCLRARAAHWRMRALAEWAFSPRSWLCTLTLTPDAQFLLNSRARRSIDAQGLDLDALPASDKFDLLSRELGKLVTLYLKRLRKGEIGTGTVAAPQYPPAQFRYLMVTEAHKSGLPHCHILLHELSIDNPVRYSTICHHWKLGFSDAKLVKDRRAATYVTKYLTKSHLARARASVGYGDPSTIARP